MTITPTTPIFQEKKYSIFDLVEILTELKFKGKSTHLKVGENEYACKQLKTTMQKIKEHNIEAKGWDDGHADAVKTLNQTIQDKINEITNI